MFNLVWVRRMAELNKSKFILVAVWNWLWWCCTSQGLKIHWIWFNSWILCLSWAWGSKICFCLQVKLSGLNIFMLDPFVGAKSFAWLVSFKVVFFKPLSRGSNSHIPRYPKLFIFISRSIMLHAKHNLVSCGVPRKSGHFWESEKSFTLFFIF